MPVDPLGKVTIIPRGVDPERRPTAPPPKRGSGAVASPAPARPPKPNLRPTPEVAAKAAEIRATVPPARTQAELERDQRIRELRAKARGVGGGTKEERADAAYKARLAEREAKAAAPTEPAAPPAAGKVTPKSNGTPEERETWRQRLSVAMKASWEKRRQARATLGEKLLQKVETVKADLAETLLSPLTTTQVAAIAADYNAALAKESVRRAEAAEVLTALADADRRADAALLDGFDTTRRAPAIAAEQTRDAHADCASQSHGRQVGDTLALTVPKGGSPAATGSAAPDEGNRQSAPIPTGAHVVVDRLDARVGEVALELDFEEAFGFRVARSHEGGDPDAPAVATILCHGKLQAEPVGIVDPARARAIAARLLAAADLAEALLRTPDDQLAAFVLRGMEA